MTFIGKNRTFSRKSIRHFLLLSDLGPIPATKEEKTHRNGKTSFVFVYFIELLCFFVIPSLPIETLIPLIVHAKKTTKKVICPLSSTHRILFFHVLTILL